MTTLAQACKAIVNAAVDLDYDSYTVKHVYNSEYGNFNGTTPKACKSYLQGLPSVCTVPFYNGEILATLEAQGISRKTEAGNDKLIEAYWNECGYQFWKLVK